jgi:hypothetical protein
MNEPSEARREARRCAIEAMRRQFETEGNPLYAWDAFAWARSDGLPVPEWVLVYMDQAAKALGSLVNQAGEGRALKDPASSVSAAFGMKTSRGTPTVFHRVAGRRDWEWLAQGEQVAAHRRAGNNETDAIYLVAKDLGKGKSTIRDAWKRYVNEFPDTALRK